MSNFHLLYVLSSVTCTTVFISWSLFYIRNIKLWNKNQTRLFFFISYSKSDTNLCPLWTVIIKNVTFSFSPYLSSWINLLLLEAPISRYGVKHHRPAHPYTQSEYRAVLAGSIETCRHSAHVYGSRLNRRGMPKKFCRSAFYQCSQGMAESSDRCVLRGGCPTRTQ